MKLLKKQDHNINPQGGKCRRTGLFYLFLFAMLLSFKGYTQVTTLNYTACPNQIVTVTPVWNNVANISYTLYTPNTPSGFFPAGISTFPFPNSTSFTISTSNANAICATYTLTGQGTSNTGPATSTATFQLCSAPPAALQFTNSIYYCAGSSATIQATPGGYSYNLTTSGNQYNINNNPSNILILNNLPANQNFVCTIVSVGTCTQTGTTTVVTSPNAPLAANASSNVCSGQPVNLQATLANATNFQWFDPLNTQIATAANYQIPSTNANSAGVYTVTADLVFPTPAISGGTTCPRKATTSVSVVVTNPVSVSASPNNVVCQGDKLSFTALAGNNVVGWVWSGPQNFAASISNPNINPSMPTNSGNYTVTALFTNNVITCTTSAAINVSVVPVSQPVITMPQAVCEGANVTFSATAPSAIAYTWVGPGPFPGSNAQAPSISSVQSNYSGIYYVTAKFQINSTSCVSTNSAQLNVIPVNTVTVIPPAKVCQPDNGYLQASAIGANNYLWQGPNNFSYPAANAVVYYPDPSYTGVYTVTAYFQGNNITCTKSNTVQLTVYPILTFTLIDRQQACYNTPLTVTGPSGASSYTWTSSTGFTSNSKDISFPSVQPNNSGTYTLNISLGPCVTSGSTTIDVLTPINFTLTPKDRTICSGDTTVLEVGATGGSQNYAYYWSPSVFLDNPIGTQKIISPTGSIMYNIVAHDIACPNYTVGTSFSINVMQPPRPEIELNTIYGCDPLAVKVTNHAWNESAITTYDFGGSRVRQGNDIDSTLTQVLTPAGIYTLNIYTKGSNGCSGKYTHPYYVTVNHKPGAEIYWSPDPPTTSDEVTFSYGVAYGPVEYFKWSFYGGKPTVIDTTIKITDGSDTSIVARPSRVYDLIGKYPVALIVQNDRGCVDTVYKLITISDDFHLYIPNTFTPNDDGVNDLFMVKGSGVKVEGFSLEILDRWGNVIFITKDINEGWDGKVKGGNFGTDNTYNYRVKAVGMNGEGRREFTGHVNIIK